MGAESLSQTELFIQGSNSLAYKELQDSVYIQSDSTIYRKTLITSCKETVQLAHSRNTSYNFIITHGVVYIKSMFVKLNHR